MSGRLVSCIWSRLTYSCRPRLLDRTSLTRFVTPVLGRDAVLARNYATSEPGMMFVLKLTYANLELRSDNITGYFGNRIGAWWRCAKINNFYLKPANIFSITATGYRFSKSHEWTSLDGTKATIGVTNYAQVYPVYQLGYM